MVEDKVVETKDKLLLRKERLIKRIANPDSIVIIKPPAKVFSSVSEVNSKFRQSIWKILSRKIEPYKIEEAKRKAYDLAKAGWESLSRIYVFASANRIEDWRLFNDSYEEKKTLIELNLRNNIQVVIPANDMCGMLYTVVKHMCIARRKLKWEVDLKYAEILSETADILISGCKDIVDILDAQHTT